MRKNPSSVRTIPIHSKIVPLVKKYLGNKYLFEVENEKINYKTMYHKDVPFINKSLNTAGHTFHDTRHTFTTKLRELDVDAFYIDELTGHIHRSVTDSVYTHISVEKLRVEIEKLKY